MGTSNTFIETKTLDEDQLAQRFSSCHGRLWRMVRFRMDPKLLARLSPDDVLQEAYLAASRRLDHYSDFASKISEDTYSKVGQEGEKPDAVFFWMRWIVRQTLIDMQRKHLGAAKRDAFREISLQGNWGHDQTCDTSSSLSFAITGILPAKNGRSFTISSPSQKLMRKENSEKLREAIEKMDEIDREVLALRHFEELTNSEVAVSLNITAKNASIRYVRALKRLKGMMDVES